MVSNFSHFANTKSREKTMSQPTCLIQQTSCGRLDGNPVCPKCGIDERIRYVSEEARQLAVANGKAKYWEVQAKSLEEKPPVAPTPEPPKPPEPQPPLTPKPSQPPDQPLHAGSSKSVLGWLAVALALLGGGLGIWRYQEDKVVEAQLQAASARLSLEQEKNKTAAVPAAQAPAPTQIAAPSPTRCTDCPEMVVVPGGSFQMGSNDSDSDNDEKFVRSVSVKSFAIGKYEVTQGQWRVIMGSNPSHFANCGDNCPVERVSWDDIQSYIQKLNQKTGQQYRLPSEAEWEYACRGGQQQKYCGSNDVGSVAWYYANSANTTHPVGQKAPNDYGLHDMSGNVYEWVQDRYNKSYQGAPTDGSAWETGAVERVLRGGSWINVARSSRSAIRFDISPGYRLNDIGFRLARTAL